MTIINKTIHGHNSIGIINKMMALSIEELNSDKKKRAFPDTTNMKEYLKAYGELIPKNKLVLHPKDFKSYGSYMKALESDRCFIGNKELRKFIKEQVNGGFCFDEASVMI